MPYLQAVHRLRKGEGEVGGDDEKQRKAVIKRRVVLKIVEGNIERLTYKTNGKFTNTIIEQAPPYSIYCDIDTAITKLAEYEDLEEQGKLLKPPCANWMEIVFGNQELFYGIDMDYMENPIREVSVDNSERITWYDGWKTVVLKGVDENGFDWEFLPEEIGKTVFLTRKEAEAALKELKAD